MVDDRKEPQIPPKEVMGDLLLHHSLLQVSLWSQGLWEATVTVQRQHEHPQNKPAVRDTYS